MMETYQNMMLCSPSDVKAQTAVNYNVSDTEIGAAIRRAQSMRLVEVLGSVLLRKLQMLLSSSKNQERDGIETPLNGKYAELWKSYVRPLLIVMAVDELAVQIAFKMRNIGVSRNSDTGITPVSLDELRYMQDAIRTEIASYSTDLSFYLCDHYDDFPELSEQVSGADVSPTLGKHFANTSLWMGGGRRGCGCGKR